MKRVALYARVSSETSVRSSKSAFNVLKDKAFY